MRPSGGLAQLFAAPFAWQVLSDIAVLDLDRRVWSFPSIKYAVCMHKRWACVAFCVACYLFVRRLAGGAACNPASHTLFVALIGDF